MFAILSAGLTIDFGGEIEDERTLLAVLEEDPSPPRHHRISSGEMILISTRISRETGSVPPHHRLKPWQTPREHVE